MTRTRWKSGAPATFALWLLFTCAQAVSLTQCSTQNTGLGGQSSNSLYMSNGQCHDNCQGHAFAITQFQNCWCSNQAPDSTTSTGSCSQQCPGWPSENCGNEQQGLYGYIALGPAPQGTLGAGGGSSGRGSSVVSVQPSQPVSSAPPAPPQPTTQVVISSQPAPTVVQTQISTRISIYSPPTSAPVTIIHTEQSTEVQTTSIPPTTVTQDPSTAFVTGPTNTVTPTPVVITSAQATTVNGQPLTSYVTATPSVMPSSVPVNEMPHQTKAGLSNGAVAGVTIGAIVGAALLAGLIFFLCWRRRKDQQSGDSEGVGGAPRRNASVLSRVGLLRGSNANDGTTEATLPRITTTGLPAGSGPESAITAASWEMGESRRNSRPLFSDNRLNPNALMQQPNFSRTSVSTLQDNQDYSRPLEIRNPDR